MAVNSVVSKEYGNDKQILIAPELAFTVGCQVSNKGISANAEGKIIIKAGTPVGGTENVLLNRAEVLAQDAENAQGVLLHDVDVTAGDNNATLVVSGYIDVEKVDSDVKDLLTTASAKLTKITLMSGYKN